MDVIKYFLGLILCGIVLAADDDKPNQQDPKWRPFPKRK